MNISHQMVSNNFILNNLNCKIDFLKAYIVASRLRFIWEDSTRGHRNIPLVYTDSRQFPIYKQCFCFMLPFPVRDPSVYICSLGSLLNSILTFNMYDECNILHGYFPCNMFQSFQLHFFLIANTSVIFVQIPLKTSPLHTCAVHDLCYIL